MKTPLSQLRMAGLLEGISFILLLGIGMPMKYSLGIGWPNQLIGIIHGVLFILYILAIFPVRQTFAWSNVTTFWVALAAFLPFGTFVADAKIFKKLA